MFGIFKNIFSRPDQSLLKEAVKNGAFLVDVRTPSEFMRGSVKGAVNIPLNTVTRELSRFQNKKKIVVFCRSGNRSSQAKNILIQNGFQNVINGGTWNHVQQLLNE